MYVEIIYWEFVQKMFRWCSDRVQIMFILVFFFVKNTLGYSLLNFISSVSFSRSSLKLFWWKLLLINHTDLKERREININEKKSFIKVSQKLKSKAMKRDSKLKINKVINQWMVIDLKTLRKTFFFFKLLILKLFKILFKIILNCIDKF